MVARRGVGDGNQAETCRTENREGVEQRAALGMGPDGQGWKDNRSRNCGKTQGAPKPAITAFATEQALLLGVELRLQLEERAFVACRCAGVYAAA